MFPLASMSALVVAETLPLSAIDAPVEELRVFTSVVADETGPLIVTLPPENILRSFAFNTFPIETVEPAVVPATIVVVPPKVPFRTVTVPAWFCLVGVAVFKLTVPFLAAVLPVVKVPPGILIPAPVVAPAIAVMLPAVPPAEVVVIATPVGSVIEPDPPPVPANAKRFTAPPFPLPEVLADVIFVIETVLVRSILPPVAEPPVMVKVVLVSPAFPPIG